MAAPVPTASLFSTTPVANSFTGADPSFLDRLGTGQRKEDDLWSQAVEGPGAVMMLFRKGLPVMTTSGDQPALLPAAGVAAALPELKLPRSDGNGVLTSVEAAPFVVLGRLPDGRVVSCADTDMASEEVLARIAGLSADATPPQEPSEADPGPGGSEPRLYLPQSGRSLLASAAVTGGPAGGLYAYASGMLTWRTRTRFCGSCGSPLVPYDAGVKLRCSDAHGTGCSTRVYPRTDSVVIVAVLSPDRSRCLVGCSSTWPNGMMSCLSGFIEPGEAIEEAAAREVMEEAGVAVEGVRVHSSQPWPVGRGTYTQLMVGCHARVPDSHPIDPETGLPVVDVETAGELVGVAWLTKQEAAEALDRGARFGQRLQAATGPRHKAVGLPPPEAAAAAEGAEARTAQAAKAHGSGGGGSGGGGGGREGGSKAERGTFVPPPYAIAHTLIKAWVEDTI